VMFRDGKTVETQSPQLWAFSRATGGCCRPGASAHVGERQFRDGDRIRHARWGDGIVVTSKLTRSDEEVTVGFKDASVGRKTMLVSLANLDLIG